MLPAAKPKVRHEFVYLASQSPRRRELLAQIGVRAELLLPEPDEDAESLETVKPGEAPADYVVRVTAAKLNAALMRRRRLKLPVAPVLCADTTVALGRRIFGKPVDAADAMSTLTALAGRSHHVLTAVAVSTGRKTVQALSASVVFLAPMRAAEVRAYVASGESLGKAGSYAIQGRMAQWVERIDGSHSGIMGLPLHETALLLRQCGVRF